MLPYDDPDPIVVLPVYADSELEVSSSWVGDFEAGSNVRLLSVHVDGHACYIEGKVFQGGKSKGGWHITGSSSMSQRLSLIPMNRSIVSLLSYIPE